jgi:hypothetical protein
MSRIEFDAGVTSIVIPGRPRLVGIFLLVWVSFWTVGGVSAMSTFAASVRRGEPVWFLALWLVGWTIGEVTVLGTLAYMFAGREIVAVRPGELEIRLELIGLRLARQYDLTRVKDVRLMSSNGRNHFHAALAFDYGARTVRFGRGIDEAEAAIILSDLKGMLPNSA